MKWSHSTQRCSAQQLFSRERRRYLMLSLVVWVTTLTPPSAAQALNLVRAPYLQQATGASMIVRWRTDLPSESTLRYGPAFNDLSTTISLAGPVTEHELEVQGLDPETRYYYSVGTSTEVLAGMDSEHYFTTTPPVDTEQATRLWVIGDSGGFSVKSAAVRDTYLNFAGSNLADLFLLLGDNAYLTGTDLEYTINFFQSYPTILRNTVLWPSPGNHEFQGTPPQSSDPVTQTGPYFDAFTMPTQGEAGGVPSGTETYYSYNYANIHFVSFNHYNIDISVGGAAYTWLVADLAANEQDWVIIYLHFPPYSRGGRDSDTDFHMKNVRTIFNPVFEQGGADLVLTGHSHTYERSMLIDGHYGVANTLTPQNIIHAGDGNPSGDGPYVKASGGNSAHGGTVYVVNGVGENAHADGGALDHPIMVAGFEVEGSMVIDIDGNTLDGYFISRYGDVLDQFQIVKSGPVPVPAGRTGAWVLLALLLVISAWTISRRALAKS